VQSSTRFDRETQLTDGTDKPKLFYTGSRIAYRTALEILHLVKDLTCIIDPI